LQARLADTVGFIAFTVASAPTDDTSARNNVEKVQPDRRLSVRINSESLSVIELENDDQSGEGNVDPNGLSKSFADMFGNTDLGCDWFPVRPRTRSPKKTQQKPVRKIIGANETAELRVKAVAKLARQSGWHIFAGGLLPTTTEDDVMALLEDQGVKVISCQLLSKTADWQKKYSAFHVVVDIRDKDRPTVFNEACWPAGADVRDLWFKTA